MQVVATRKGFFGGALKDPGDSFMLSDEAEFSEVWMAKAGSGEADKMLRETRKQGVSDEQIAQEQAAATGKAVAAGGDKALKAKIAELEKELEAAKARDVELQGYIDLLESEQAGAANEGTDGDASEEEETGEADEAPAPVRISRRSR